MEILRIIFETVGLVAFVGLIIMHCFEQQWQKNIETKLNTFKINLESYQLHVKGDIQIWTETAQNNKENLQALKNKFSEFEQQYISHQLQTEQRLLALEDKTKND